MSTAFNDRDLLKTPL